MRQEPDSAVGAVVGGGQPRAAVVVLAFAIAPAAAVPVMPTSPMPFARPPKG